MQSRIERERHKNLIITDRPDSSQLVDLHVYIIPRKVWKNHQNLAENIAIDQAISAGFVRIPENLTIYDLRQYIIDTCSDDQDFPKEFIYLRSVGRCLTKVKQQQEKQLKVKNYRPPTTIASEIYILEENHDENSSILAYKKDDFSRKTPMSSQKELLISYPLFDHNSVIFPAKLSPRDLLKLRQEQERLYYRQIELARQRHEIEKQYHKEEQAAIKIQTIFRNYRHQKRLKQQEIDDIEFDERQGYNVVKLSNRLEKLRIKRLKLEANQKLVVNRMQQLHNQINNQRRKEKDLLKKNQITTYDEEKYVLSKNSIDIRNQFKQAKIRLNNTTKLRQQAEYQSRLLRQELQHINSNLNILERYRIPKEQNRICFF